MDKNKKCGELAEKIRNLKQIIDKREGPTNNGISLRLPVPDETTEENTETLLQLEKEYQLNCGDLK